MLIAKGGDVSREREIVTFLTARKIFNGSVSLDDVASRGTLLDDLPLGYNVDYSLGNSFLTLEIQSADP